MQRSLPPYSLPTPINEDSAKKFETYVSYFNDVVTHHNCPFCNAIEWIIQPDPPDGAVPGIVIQSRQTASGKNGLEAFHSLILVICNNCGFIRQHHRLPFKNWLVKTGREIEKDRIDE